MTNARTYTSSHTRPSGLSSELMVVDVEMRTWEERNGRVVVTFSVSAFARSRQNNPRQASGPRRICYENKIIIAEGGGGGCFESGNEQPALASCLIASFREGEEGEKMLRSKKKRGFLKENIRCAPSMVEEDPRGVPRKPDSPCKPPNN